MSIRAIVYSGSGRVVLFACLLVSLLAVRPEPGYSAPAPGALRDIQRQQEQILLQQRERELLQQRQFLESGKRATQGLQPELLPEAQGAKDAPCMRVRGISVSGSTLLSGGAVDALTAPYQNTCMTLVDINNLLRNITNTYIEKGYITTRAFVDPAEQTPGLLRVLVIEGTVEDIIVNDGDKNSYYRGKTAFPSMIGSVLNLRDIEQGIDQLNRLPSASATVELVPGKETGGTIVKVTNQTKRSWRFGLGFDNLGQRSTGRGMYNLYLEKDNLMGIGDQFAVYWSEDIQFWDSEIRSRDRIGKNNSLSGYFSIPWGYWTVSGSVSRFSYDTTIFGLGTEYTSSGTTNLAGIKVDRIIHRDADSKTSLFGGINYRSVNSYIESIRLASSSYRLATLELGATHNRRFLGGVMGLNFTYTRGLNAFGSNSGDPVSHYDPEAQFDKYTLLLTYYRPFNIGEQSLYWNFLAFAQLSPDTLYGAERLQIGGRSTVRGFLDDTLTGDQGAYFRNELGWDLPWFDLLRTKGPVNGLQLYAAYDVGFLYRDKKDEYEHGTMQGAALGLRTYGPLTVDFAVAKPIHAPSYIDKRDMEIYLSVRYEF